jgi:hypothetical protein
MNPLPAVQAYFSELARGTAQAWTRFWFTPTDPATLSAIRILAGLMLLYTHAIWSIDLVEFFGPQSWVNPQAMPAYYSARSMSDTWAWSHFWWIESTEGLWAAHLAALVVFLLLTLGLFSRVMSVLAWLLTVSYAHRAHGALFGLDQINALLAMYLMVGPCGARWSLDRWRASRAGQGRGVKSDPPVESSMWANVAVRLIQVHMCVVYFFAGASKLAGTAWWDGTAMWISFASAEYQTLDLTWLAGWPMTVAFLTHATVYWELTYCVLVWPRLTRPLVLGLAVLTHVGIGVVLGMMTFGLAMLIGNVAFIPPEMLVALASRRGRAGQGGASS